MIPIVKVNIAPIQSKTTKEMVYEELKNAILIGDIEKDTILTEVVLAESLNTSRTPVREAVRDLMKEGLIVSVPRKGFKLRTVTQGEKEQIIFLRITLETEGMKTLSNKITLEQTDTLRKLLLEQKEVMHQNKFIEFIELDQKFHRTLLSFAELHLLEEIFLNIYNLARLMGHQALTKQGRKEAVIEEHEKIIEALAAKDSERAIASMRSHLLNTNNTIV